jgi:hypothetical protein
LSEFSAGFAVGGGKMRVSSYTSAGKNVMSDTEVNINAHFFLTLILGNDNV